nr:hypothetical protein BDOA9_0122720 [Bradyrhizobium sp. DOA9]
MRNPLCFVGGERIDGFRWRSTHPTGCRGCFAGKHFPHKGEMASDATALTLASTPSVVLPDGQNTPALGRQPSAKYSYLQKFGFAVQRAIPPATRGVSRSSRNAGRDAVAATASARVVAAGRETVSSDRRDTTRR